MKKHTVETGFVHLKLEQVVPSDVNPGGARKGIEGLTASVKEKGIIQPIIVRPVKGNGHYEIVAGHRRFLAATNAGLDTIPAIVQELPDDEALEVAIVENDQREDANPLDEAKAFKRLMENDEAETIAARIGRPVGYVLGRVRLLGLCKEAKQALSSGKISLGHSQVLLRLRGKDEQRALLSDILSGEGGHGITVAAAKAMVRENSLALADAPFDTEGCASCSFRSGNQAELFPELKDTDECSDRACFYKKTLAYYRAQTKEKEDAGFRVIKDIEDIKELGGFSGDKMKLIVPSAKEASPYSYPASYFPPKYKSKCEKCTDHHAFYVYEEKVYSGTRVEAGEVCLNPKCLAEMLKEKEKAKETTRDKVKTNGESTDKPVREVNPITLKLHAEAARDRFMVTHLTPRVESSEALTKRFIFYHMLDRFTYFSGNAKQVRDKIIREICPTEYFKEKKFSGWHLYLLVMAVPEKKLSDLLTKVVLATIPFTDPKALLHMTPEAGIDMTRDFVMDETFINSKTKAELLRMVKDLGLNVSATEKNKKAEIVAAIQAQDLVGKATPELAESFALKELKDVSNPMISRYAMEDEDVPTAEEEIEELAEEETVEAA
ncbi:MAG: ParB/RepB/Spo0J family partition protein [Nitrospirota bacterium]